MAVWRNLLFENRPFRIVLTVAESLCCVSLNVGGRSCHRTPHSRFKSSHQQGTKKHSLFSSRRDQTRLCLCLCFAISPMNSLFRTFWYGAMTNSTAGMPRIALCDNFHSPIHIDVGGTIFNSSLFTLTSYPDSNLSKMFNGTEPVVLDVMRQNYFIDRDGAMFHHVLNFLRNKKLLLPLDFAHCDLLLAEAEYYKLNDMVREIKKFKVVQEGIGAGHRQSKADVECNYARLVRETDRLKRRTEALLKEHGKIMQPTELKE